MMARRITPVILSGGAGSRLWPLSSGATPKQFLALAGKLTMLQLTAQRVSDPAMFNPPVVIGAEEHESRIESQLREIGIELSRLILEPCARGTAAAAALSALTGRGDELLLLMPSDHLIREPEAFMSALEALAPMAEQGWLATFGIEATYAETGYGYIQCGEKIAPGVARAARFIEKPDSRAAARMLEEGNYCWNSGIFLFEGAALLRELEAHAPDIFDCVQASLLGTVAGERQMRPEGAAFSRCRAESIDRAVMEKAEQMAVARVEMGWTDIGSWDAILEASSKDPQGNALFGPANVIGARSCLVRSDGPRVVAIGVEDLIIVATADAVLVVPRGQSQRVREAVDLLRPADDLPNANGRK